MTPARLKRLRQLLWLYFWLLIFEGALRKWVLPGLSTPLLLVRDPLALLALWWGLPLLRQRRWQIWLQSLFVIGLIAFLLAFTVGHGDIPTALFGTRVFLVQLPLIFVYASVFDRTDVIHFAWALAWASIPMTLLIVVQSNLPPTHILNISPGGEGTATFSGALSFFRPPGSFSFINGLTLFYTLSASALLSLIYGTKLSVQRRVFCLLVAVALLVALPVSISRGLLAGYLQVLAAVIAMLALSRGRFIHVLFGLLGFLVAIGIATTIPAFQARSEAFVVRWEQAAAIEAGDDAALGGGVGVFRNRLLGDYTRAFSNLEKKPLTGYGVGLGTQVGSQRLGEDSRWLVGESGWENGMGELGLPLGLAFITWRTLLALWILRLSLRAAAKGSVIPLIMTGSCFLLVLGGQLGQPTGLGLLVFSAGLTLASCNSGVRLPVRVQAVGSRSAKFDSP